jgi:hypothetical protein
LNRCSSPVPLEDLVGWERGELEPAAADQVEEHFIGCEECSRRLETVVRLGAAISGLVRAGGFPVAVTGSLLDAVVRRGLRVRTYRLAPGDRVACTAGPEDDFVAVRLGMDAEAGDSVDLVADFVDIETGAHESRLTEDVVVDPVTAEVVYLYPGEAIRSLPRSRWSVTARVRGPKGERRLGPYTLDHTPWEQLPHRS